MDSEAYLVDDEWVFRFPKRESVARTLGREVALLPKLAVRLPVAIPRFVYVGRQAGSGLVFVGYRLIPRCSASSMPATTSIRSWPPSRPPRSTMPS